MNTHVTIAGVKRRQSPYAMTWTQFFQRKAHPSVRLRAAGYVVEVNVDRHDVIVLDVHGRVLASRAFDPTGAARAVDSLAQVGLSPWESTS